MGACVFHQLHGVSFNLTADIENTDGCIILPMQCGKFQVDSSRLPTLPLMLTHCVIRTFQMASQVFFKMPLTMD